ncbi:MAG: hypothetical protein J6J42_12385, partial [Lachnospiraceae bacterium]|nr:hypothetical protein [Lachnospiraceae bacterium]
WDMQYYNGTGSDTKNVTGTTAMVSEGETVTVSVVMPEEVVTTWFVAPVIVAEGVGNVDFTMNSITIDG